MSAYTRTEMMTVVAARLLRPDDVCFVGIGLPSAAANLARATHAPDCVLVYESGAIGAKPAVLPLAIGDGELAETADAVVPIPEIFAYWLQGGRIDVGFLGAAQVDRFANINSTVIGDYASPKVRLPGAGGAPAIAAHAKRVHVVIEQTRRTFPERLDFVTSAPAGPTIVITDLGVLETDPETRELRLVALHPDVAVEDVRAATGWPLAVAGALRETPPPTALELETLRRLHSATEAAHAARRPH